MQGSPIRSKEEILREQKINAQRFAEIRKNIQIGREGNVEIRFDASTVQCAKGIFSIGNTIAKIRVEGYDAAEYIFLKEGETWDTQVFIGGAPKEAYLVTKNDMDTEYMEDGDCLEDIECVKYYDE